MPLHRVCKADAVPTGHAAQALESDLRHSVESESELTDRLRVAHAQVAYWRGSSEACERRLSQVDRAEVATELAPSLRKREREEAHGRDARGLTACLPLEAALHVCGAAAEVAQFARHVENAQESIGRLHGAVGAYDAWLSS